MPNFLKTLSVANYFIQQYDQNYWNMNKMNIKENGIALILEMKHHEYEYIKYFNYSYARKYFFKSLSIAKRFMQKFI